MGPIILIRTLTTDMDWKNLKLSLENADDASVKGLIATEDFWRQPSNLILKSANFLRLRKRFGLALRLLSFFDSNGHSFSEKERILALYLIGDIYHDTDQYKLAIDLYTSILSKEESDMAYNNRALAFWELGDYRSAQKDYKSAISLNEKNWTSHRGFAEMTIKLNDPNLALQHFKKAILENPKYVNAYAGCGIALTRLGRNDDARQYLEKALEIDPECGVAKKALEDL